jgi:hypothetical protein
MISTAFESAQPAIGIPKKRGPKTKLHQGPLPDHLKLLARLCIKHDGPGNLTYWDRIFEDAEQLSSELFDMINERKAKYQTFKKSRLRFLVDRPYRKAFNAYRLNCEQITDRCASPISVVQTKRLAAADTQSKPAKFNTQAEADETCFVLPCRLKRFAGATANSDLGSGCDACFDCLRRITPEAKDYAKLDSKIKRAVLDYKNETHELLKDNVIPPHQVEYNDIVDGMHHFQKFMAKHNEHLSLFSKDERNLPVIFKEFAFHLSRARLYESVYKTEWLFLHHQPMCMALRTLLQKNRKLLMQCRGKECFKSFLSKIYPLVISLERDRVDHVTCGSRAGNLIIAKASQRDDAASALLTLAHSDSSSYTSDGSL